MSTYVMTGTAAHDIATGQRVRAVMASESEVCHLWAAGQQDHGRFRAVYFSGKRLYSYGSHYVIGERVEPGVVLLNAESNSMTTNGHRRAADYATQHMTRYWIPDLTRILRVLDDFERGKREVTNARKRGEDIENPESYVARYSRPLMARAKAELRRDILADWRAFEPYPESAVYLLGRVGFDGGRTWPAIAKEGAKLEAKRKAEAERQAKARALADAKLFGDCSAVEFARYWPADKYESDSLADGYGEAAQASFAKRLARAHKASKAAGYTDRTRRLWARLKEYRGCAASHKARLRKASEAERLAAWQAGHDINRLGGRLSMPDGSAALRIVGDILETSHGARVPLAEAVAAFRFVKLLRTRAPLEGEAEGGRPVVWKANGRQVRVGPYALTRVFADGGFIAGCHLINWPEIERAAALAGVLEAEPSDAAEVTSK